MTQESSRTSSPPRSATPFHLLDSHLHLPGVQPAGSPYAAWDLSETGFVEHLDRCGIRQGVVHAVSQNGEGKAEAFISANRNVLRFVERFPGRFTGACALDLSLVEESLQEMEDWKNRFGMVWVAEIAFDPEASLTDRKAFDRILEQAAALSLIVSVDTLPEGMSYIVEKHADTAVVFPQLEKGRAFRRIQIAGQGNNHYLDTSPKGYERMGLIELAVETLGIPRLLYGSNFSVTDPAAVIARLENAFLSEQQKQAIFSGNALALLGLAGWSF